MAKTADERREYLQKWHAADRRRTLFQHARNRAKKLELPFTITIDDIVIPNFCPILGIELRKGEGKSCDHSPSLDRIVPSLGYVPGNIQVISYRANRIKNDASLDELRKLVAHLEQVTR